MLSLNDLAETNELFQSTGKSTQLTRYERKAKERAAAGDRFIPSRESMNHDISVHKTLTTDKENNAEDANGANGAFKNQLAQSLFAGDDLNSKVLAFKTKAPAAPDGFQNDLRVLYTQNKTSMVKTKKPTRHIASTPERILDAPELLDDYYLNLLAWSPRGVLAVALGRCVYLWNAISGDTELLCETKEEEEYVCSVKWMVDGSHVAIGISDGDVQMWNVDRKKQVRSMKGHQARVGALAWNNHILSSGSRDSNIFHHDVRVAQHHVGTLAGHTQEICGLEWSPDGTQLASGGNDNLCCIWDVNNTTGGAQFTFNECNAAVKAVAWCPFESKVLATGGGTADRHIRFYDTSIGSMTNAVDTHSQVCSLVWSTTSKELLSSHGFSENQLTLWKYPTMARIKELPGHTSRVLHTALSPDGATVCSAAADETLRFWRVWEPVGKSDEETQRAERVQQMKKKQASRLNLTIR